MDVDGCDGDELRIQRLQDLGNVHHQHQKIGSQHVIVQGTHQKHNAKGKHIIWRAAASLRMKEHSRSISRMMRLQVTGMTGRTLAREWTLSKGHMTVRKRFTHCVYVDRIEVPI